MLSLFISYSLFLTFFSGLYSFINFKLKKIFVTVLGLCSFAWAFSSRDERGLHFIAVHGLLIAVTSLVVQRRF